MARKLELFYPVKNPYFVTQKFGEALIDYSKPPFNLPSGKHNGLDIWGQDGQIARAAHDGIVTFAGDDGSAGLGVVIRTEDERIYGNGTAFFKTIYWHLKTNSILVKAGDKIRVGDPLARCNTTGKATGAHLHFGLKPVKQGEADWQWYNLEQDNGYLGAIDPAPYWNGLYAEDYRSISDQLSLIAKKLAELFAAIKGR